MTSAPAPPSPPASLDAAILFAHGRRPSQPLQGHGFLVHGARASGKSSLAFQAAVNTVANHNSSSGSATAENGAQQQHVLVLCQESVFYAKVPVPFTPLSTLPGSVLGRIEFIYVDSWQAALREVMELRTTQAVPPLLLIDDDGFEMNSATSQRGGGKGGGGQHADALASTAAAAACLSYLASIHDWMARNAKPFSYIVVTNQLPESATLLPLPFAAFPLVNVWVGASGVVQVTPVPSDRTAVPPAYVTWRNGLQLR